VIADGACSAGGFLILSTPNLAQLHSRWHFF
jgi:hypothetical protein